MKAFSVIAVPLSESTFTAVTKKKKKRFGEPAIDFYGKAVSYVV